MADGEVQAMRTLGSAPEAAGFAAAPLPLGEAAGLALAAAEVAGLAAAEVVEGLASAEVAGLAEAAAPLAGAVLGEAGVALPPHAAKKTPKPRNMAGRDRTERTSMPLPSTRG